MTPTPAMDLDAKPQPGWFGLTMHAARGSSAPGRWWSVISVAMPSALARATPSTLAMPLSTVMRRSGWRPAAMSTSSGVRP